MEFDPPKDTLHRVIVRKRHWRSALFTVLRLRKYEGLVDDENLAALNLILCPPTFNTALSPKLASQLDSYLSNETFVDMWKSEHDWIAKIKPCPLVIGEMYCSKIGLQYWNISERKLQPGGFWCSVLRRVLRCVSPFHYEKR